MSSTLFDARSSQRSSTFIENYRTFSPSLGSASEGRLDRGRWAKPDIATALSSSGWLATASVTKIKLYRLRDVDRSREIKRIWSIECKAEGEVRGIALSADLLAIVTRSHLLVYEYREPGSKPVESRVIDQNETWTPKSVAIRQTGSVGASSEATAMVAVGGEGKSAVKMFKYSYTNCWSAQSDRVTLSCALNTTSIKAVGFSTDRPDAADRVSVFGVTTTNRIHCWAVNEKKRNHRVPEPNWSSSLSLRTGTGIVPLRGEISSVGVFLSPSYRPYIFCAVNQRQGSQILRTGIASLESTQRSLDDVASDKSFMQSEHAASGTPWRELPEEAVGRNVLCATVTPNGMFIVVIEDGWMRLLTLQGAYDGGLTCRGSPLSWRTPLRPAAVDVAALSLSVREEYGALEIVAADGHGRVAFARISVPSMPPPEPPRSHKARVSELSNLGVKLELASEDRGWGSTTTAHSRSAVDTDRMEARIDSVASSEAIAETVSKVLSRASSHCPNCPSSGTCSSHQPLYKATFAVECTLPAFLSAQYGERVPQLGSVVALTGSVACAQATTCADYITTTWPQGGQDLLEALQSTLFTHGYTSGPKKAVHPLPEPSTSLTVTVSETRLQVKVVRADRQRIIELAQQLAWIGSVLRSSPYDDQLAYSTPVVHDTLPKAAKSNVFGAEKNGNLWFNITFNQSPAQSTEAACWLPLFCGASLALGFPVPDRKDEKGLEIPVQILAAITGVRHAVEFEGTVVMKGFSSMLVPINKEGDIVQWHLISSADPNIPLSYQDGLSRCIDRAPLRRVGLQDALSSRAIVGWCTAAESSLGSDTADYENINYSKSTDTTPSVKVSGGSIGIQQFAFAQMNFSFGEKDGKCHHERRGRYQTVISAAERTPVILYDTGDNRAWLVPATGVILHIAQHRHRLEPFEVNGAIARLIRSLSPSGSAKETLLQNASVSLDDERYTLKHLVLDIWSQLEFLIAQNVTGGHTTPGTPIRNPLNEYISGFEYKAVVQERSPYRHKQTKIRKTSGGWTDLARDIDALVLFANGYGDVLRPRDLTGLCAPWHTMPPSKDYLATSVCTLNDLYDMAGCRSDRRYLTSTKLQWHRGDSSLFEPCANPRSPPCQCDRLQQITSKPTLRRKIFRRGTEVTPPGLLVTDGAVIFGQFKSSLGTRSSTVEQEREGLFKQQDPRLVAIATVRADSASEEASLDHQQ